MLSIVLLSGTRDFFFATRRLILFGNIIAHFSTVHRLGLRKRGRAQGAPLSESATGQSRFL